MEEKFINLIKQLHQEQLEALIEIWEEMLIASTKKIRVVIAA